MNAGLVNRTEFLRAAARWGLAGCLGVLGLAFAQRHSRANVCQLPGPCETCPQSGCCAQRRGREKEKP